MTTYLATVTREDGLWVVDVDGLPPSYFGMTEVQRFSELDLEVRDLIAGLTDTDPDGFEVDWRVLFGDTDVTTWLAELDHAEAQISSWEDRRNSLRREVIRAGRAAGLSQAAVGEVLRISQQRVAQVEQTVARAAASAAPPGDGGTPHFVATLR